VAKLDRDCRLPALGVLVWAALAATAAAAAAPIEDVEPYDMEPEALHLDAHGKELLDNMSGGFQITGPWMRPDTESAHS
jgi:hypothetical protein